MASTPEGIVKKRGKALLDKHDAYYFMPVSNGMGVMGIFDIVCCLNGRFLGIECKKDANTKPTALQTRNAERTIAAGGIAFLLHCDNMQELEMLICRIKETPHGIDGGSFWPFDSGQKSDKW
mgnify:CR=1 FL=1